MSKLSTPLAVSRAAAQRWATLIAAICVTLLATASAHADFGVRPDPVDPGLPDFQAGAFEADGTTAYIQAGGHPYQMTTNFELNRTPDNLLPDGRVKEIIVDLPAGIAGDPTGIPRCRFVDLRDSARCPIQSQVGITEVRFLMGIGVDVAGTVPVYNMEPAPGDVATLAFNILNVLTSVHIQVRSDGDYGLRAIVRNPSSYLPLVGNKLTLWGVPGDPSHDPFRGTCLNQDGSSNGTCPAQTPPRPFITMPTECRAGPLITTMRIASYEHPADVKTYTAPMAGMDGCDKLTFDPTLSFQPSSDTAGAPTGATVRLHVPQNSAAVGVATPAVRKVVVRLPVGVAISPSSVDGLGACTDEQLGANKLGPEACPNASRLGTVRIDTPVLPEALHGRIYLGQPQPNQLFRLFLTAEGQGVRIKLKGTVDPDPSTGQVVATFDQNPQLPFSDLRLDFMGGPHAPLVNPRRCGAYTTTAELTPYSAPATSVASTADTFVIAKGVDGSSCASAGFDPGFEAGTVSPVAGKSSEFTLTLTRGDRDQFLSGITVDMPRGLLGRVADVPTLCADAAASAGTCDESSRIGSVTTGAGPGADPFYLPGRVYLTGPYKGAPFGLSIVVPALAGPFDLGTVVVRAALHVDRQTTQLRVISDPLPTILKGVPLQVRTVNVHINRDAFMINPTNCQVMAVDGKISSTEGVLASVKDRFQVGDCAALAFKPRMAIRVGARGRTQRGRSTPLEATVRMPASGANLRGVRVVLPTTLNALLPVINEACTLEQFQADNCEKARAGSAVALTPLLRDPLRGSVYFVRNGRPLPDLMVRLHGQVDVDLAGKVRIPGDKKLATNFDMVPDVPITRFTLRLVAGRKGPIGIAQNLCTKRARSSRVQLTFTAQSGKVVRRSQRLVIRGCGRAASRGQGGQTAGR